MTDLVVFLAVVAVIGVAGAGLGMLVARRLDAWTATRASADDEEPGDDDRPDP
ncbi:MAG: hypothetical protein WEG56_08750 [Chloroflexota bacterium]